jgi:hypothetical protein
MVHSIECYIRPRDGGEGIAMFEDRPNRDLVERAENLIVRLREVQSCRIYTDESGAISEIHVVAVTDRAPKLLARDVETCLKASLGLTVDYRKIGVVVIDPKKNTIAHMRPATATGDRKASDAAAGLGPLHGFGLASEHSTDGDDLPIVDLEELIDTTFDAHDALPKYSEPPKPVGPSSPAGPSLPPDHSKQPSPSKPPADRPEARLGAEPAAESPDKESRIAFKGLRVSIEDARIDVEVRLERGTLVVTGSQGDYRYNGRLPETVAGATLHAVSELLDEDIHLCLAGIEEVVLGGRIALCAVVNAVRDRSVTSYIGCALIGAERNESAVLAVLDALNRPLGEWKLRTEIHYTIR